MTQSVVILGGGTAGWMTASYLRAAFADSIDVTVVESRRIGTIGVGEATFSTVRHFFDYLGLSEADWMPECNGTYKLAVRLENWRAWETVSTTRSNGCESSNGVPLTDWWQRRGPTSRFDRDCFLIPWLCDAKASPRHRDGRLFEQDFAEGPDRPLYRTTLAEQNTQFPYAYHFDASLLADFLTRYAVKRGVRQIIDDVVDVRLDAHGGIDHLLTQENGELRADLYVDCSGFRSRLLGQALEEPFLSFQDSLPNDRAVALRVPVDTAREGIRPCTTATAGRGVDLDDSAVRPDRHRIRLRERVRAGPGRAGAARLRRPQGGGPGGQSHPHADRTQQSCLGEQLRGHRPVRRVRGTVAVHRHLPDPARDRTTRQVLPRHRPGSGAARRLQPQHGQGHRRGP